MMISMAACHHGKSGSNKQRANASRKSTVSFLGDALADGRTMPDFDKQRLAAARDSVTFCSITDDEGGHSTSVCKPCAHPMAETVRGAALSNARDLWLLRGSAPYDNEMTEGIIPCVWRSYEQAIKYSPQDPLIQSEYATIRMHSTDVVTRRIAVQAIDRAVDSLVLSGEQRMASAMVAASARMLWTTVQHMLERPDNVSKFEVEENFHNLVNEPITLRRLPPLERPSRDLGISEAHWVSALYQLALRLSPTNAALQARLARNALTPFVMLRDWGGIDRTVAALHDVAVTDSVLQMATALAAYSRSKHFPAEELSVMRKFDDALNTMPRADSARYDSFDGLLSVNDDLWRYEHLPDVLETLDTRGWALFDPLWSTPINEMRLAHRARMADADFLYGDTAPYGAPGSETPAGIMLMKRGAPDAHWHYERPWTNTGNSPNRLRLYVPALIRGWPGYLRGTPLSAGLTSVDVLYKDNISLQSMARGAFSLALLRQYYCDNNREVTTLAQCAQSRPSVWDGVPYVKGLDTIDVALARFRGSSGSTDLYVGARVPLRSMLPSRNATNSDSLRVALWVATLTGTPLQHIEQKRARPKADELDFVTQFRADLVAGSVMHRVEVVDDAAQRAARGGAVFTQDGATSFPSTGFGVSDILVAAAARTLKQKAVRWRDYEIVPNGASVAPRTQFALLWENYDLKPDSIGRVRWQVSVRTEKGARLLASVRNTIEAAVGSATGVKLDDPDAAFFHYEREAAAAPVIVETFYYGMDAPPGRHVVRLQIDDLVSGKSVVRTVSVRVLDPRVQRRVRAQ